jgi:hypothetical protein
MEENGEHAIDGLADAATINPDLKKMAALTTANLCQDHHCGCEGRSGLPRSKWRSGYLASTSPTTRCGSKRSLSESRNRLTWTTHCYHQHQRCQPKLSGLEGLVSVAGAPNLVGEGVRSVVLPHLAI